MRNFLATFLGAFLLFTGIPNSALAAEKVATIDMKRVLNETDAAKDKKAEIDKLIENASKKTGERQKSVLKLQEKVKGSTDPKESEKYEQEVKALERYAQDSREEISKQVAVTSKVLTTKALDLIKQYAKQHNFELVLDKSDRLRNPIIFSEGSIDITDEIIKEING